MDWSGPTLAATRDRLAARFTGFVDIDRWWAEVPGVVEGLAARWSLREMEAVGRGGSSLVLRAQAADGAPAYLKLVPEPVLADQEARALRHWAGTGRVPAVREVDAGLGALLLESLDRSASASPEAQRSSYPSAKNVAPPCPEHPASPEIAALINALHGAPAAPGAEFPPLTARVAFIFDHWERTRNALPLAAAAVSAEHFDRGRQLALDLAASPSDVVLLHGDLHPGNVMRRGSTLMAIDPRPCFGDPAFDLVDWAFTDSDRATWEPASAQLASLTGSTPERAWAWCRAFAALLAVAAVRGGQPPDHVAALLAIAP
jgi:streptomycin 6-kinase